MDFIMLDIVSLLSFLLCVCCCVFVFCMHKRINNKKARQKFILLSLKMIAVFYVIFVIAAIPAMISLLELIDGLSV